MSTRIRYSQLVVLKGADLTTRRLALLEADSGRAGPVVWLTAGLHGDEVGGTIVVHELCRRLANRPLSCGRLAAFPMLNPFGFEAASRHIPSTQEDLNRSFPGDPAGTFAQRIAHLVQTKIRAEEPALVLDLHNDWIRSIPYALIDPRPLAEAGKVAHARARECALATGLPVVDEQEEGVSRALLRSTLSGSLLEQGIPALTLELGAAYMVVEENVRAGLAAVWRVLGQLGLVERDAADVAEGSSGGYRGRVLRYSHRPFPAQAGIARFHVDPGEEVSEGTLMAELFDVFGRKLEVLRAESEALVLGHADSSLAVPGEALFAMATRRSRTRGGGRP